MNATPQRKKKGGEKHELDTVTHENKK